MVEQPPRNRLPLRVRQARVIGANPAVEWHGEKALGGLRQRVVAGTGRKVERPQPHGQHAGGRVVVHLQLDAVSHRVVLVLRERLFGRHQQSDAEA